MAIADDYELISVVSARRSGVVWKARDKRLGRLVAVKALEMPTPELRERWRAESRILAQLDHPNLVQVFGYAESDTDAYIVEEWLEAATLAEVLVDTGAMTTGQALGIVRGSLLGLSYVHEAGLVHGDVSSSNILVGTDGVSRLIDFGSASVSGSTARPGTGAFQAPEVERGETSTPAADVYAAAAVTAMLLRGRSSPTPSVDGIAAPVRGVLRTAMAADPGMRYPNAAAFLAALEQAASRQFGAAWWTQAGVGALATSALAGVATAASTASGNTSVTSGEPHSVNDIAGTRAASIPARSNGRSLRLAVASGVAAAVIAAGVLIVVHRASDDPAPAAARQTTAVSPTTTPPSPTTSSVARFQYRSVITKIDGLSVDHVGQVFTGIWTFTSTCDAAQKCATSVDTPGGKFALAATKTMTRSGTESIRCPRVDKPQALTFRQVLTIERAADGLPTALRGTGRQVSTGCDPSPTITYYDLTVTPI